MVNKTARRVTSLPCRFSGLIGLKPGLPLYPGRLFIPIHLLVGLFIGLVKGELAAFHGGDAEGDAEGQVLVAALGELLADAVHQGVGLVGTQDQKLVPAHPHGDVVGGDRLLDDIGHPLQQQVAILVAQGVVGPL